jgi:hypothetical protein
VTLRNRIILAAGIAVVGGMFLYAPIEILSDGPRAIIPIVLSLFAIGVPIFLAFYITSVSRALLVASVFVAGSLILSSGFFAYRQTHLLQIIGMFSFFSLMALAVVSVVMVLRPRGRLAAIAALIVSVVPFFVTGYARGLGHQASIRDFQQRLPQYEAAVRQVETALAASDEYTSRNGMPGEFPSLCYLVCAWKDSDRTVAEFFWGRGFPVKHTAWIYLSDGIEPEKGSELARRWHRWERVNDHWFTVSN